MSKTNANADDVFQTSKLGIILEFSQMQVYIMTEGPIDPRDVQAQGTEARQNGAQPAGADAHFEGSQDSSVSSEPIGFPVSNLKFWAMSICTVGFYEVYWGYKNFKALKVPSGKGLSAFIFAIFLPVSLFGLLKAFETQAAAAGNPISVHKLPLAWAFFLLHVVSRVMDRMLPAELSMLALIPALINLCMLAYVQRKMIAVNAAVRPNAKIDSRFSAWDITGLILGSIIILLALLGLILGALGLINLRESS